MVRFVVRRVKYYIQSAHLKHGALSNDLGIPIEANIPCTLLKKITTTKIGDVITNPTTTGYKKILVTPLVKKRAVFAKKLKGFSNRACR